MMRAARPIALCYGTRPQVIKASMVRRHLASVAPVLAVDTGQHYDYALNALLYEQLGVAPADACLEVGSASHAEQTAAILVRAEALFREHAPAAVAVIGDTNSTLGCALAAGKLRIPVLHVEAGLRARDTLMAEEINRRVVDSFAQVLCTPSATATERMRAEHPEAAVVETGDVAYDVLLAQLAALPDVAGLIPVHARDAYAYATLHRAELTDNVEHLRAVLGALGALPVPVVLAVHPRTRAVLDARGIVPAGEGRLTLIPAVGYRESVALTREARIVLTDSGGVQREAYWLGVPCVTLRPETEWTETVALGANRLVAPSEAADTLASVVASALAPGHRGSWDRHAYGAGDAAARIAAAAAELLGATAPAGA
jgi:UDP-N-acetylglucosamine 2-epimerase